MGGALGALAAWPDTNAYTGELEGGWLLVLCGVVAWLGVVMVAIGVLGLGVKLGRDASRVRA